MSALRAALNDRQSATLVAVTTLLDVLARKGEILSLAELSGFVKCDSPLMMRVMARANSLGLKNTTFGVASLPEAFHRLGLTRIRSLVLSTLLAHHADTENSLQSEMALVSLTNGLLAQSLAERSGEDGEQGFLAGALRNYGELLLATFFPDEFAAAQGAGGSEGGGRLAAAFGLHPLEVGREMLEPAHLPAGILEAATVAEHEPVRRPRGNPLSPVAIAAQRLGRLLYDPDLAPAEFRGQAHEVMRKFTPEAAVSDAEDLDRLLVAQRRQLREYARYGGFGVLAERPASTINRRIGNRPISRCPVVPARAAPGPKPKARPPPDTLEPQALPRIAEQLKADQVALFGLDRGHFYLIGRQGSWGQGLHGSLFTPGERNIFGLCAVLHQTLLIHDSSAPNIAGHIPAWMRGAHAPAAFFVMPLGAQHVVQVLLVGWASARQISAPPAATLLGIAG